MLVARNFNRVKRVFMNPAYPLILIVGILFCVVAAGMAQEQVASDDLPQYRAHYMSSPIVLDGRLTESAWKSAPVVGKFQFPWWREGTKEPTVAKILWDDVNLYIGHVCSDEWITAKYTGHDDPVAKDDCFEIMLTPNPAQPEVYFNIEWNVLGAYIDGYRKHGPKKPSVDWAADGVQIAGAYRGTLNQHADTDLSWTCEVAIPFRNFASLTQVPPQRDSFWNMNLNRHGGDRNLQYSQWSAGDTLRPSFHTPHRFGRLFFVRPE